MSTTFDEFMQDIQKAADIEALDLLFNDIEHAKSSGQITVEQYKELADYAYGPN